MLTIVINILAIAAMLAVVTTRVLFKVLKALGKLIWLAGVGIVAVVGIAVTKVHSRLEARS